MKITRFVLITCALLLYFLPDHLTTRELLISYIFTFVILSKFVPMRPTGRFI